MNQAKKRNIIIGALCGVLLLMVVGYAAFSSVLKINGTSSISSNWNIKITSITEGTKTGGATTSLNEDGNKKISGVGTLTASVEANLVSPGDSIEYDITVTNSGTIDAKLEKITTTDSNNPAIIFETSGLTEGSTLTANGGTAILKLKITYDSSVTSQPENTTGTLSVTLDYVQNDVNNPILPDNDFVYRCTTDVLHPNDSIEGIETTTDYTTLGKNVFLKHNVTDGIVESSEVCFIKDGLHCLIGGLIDEDNEVAYETNKAMLLSVFGESACTDNDSSVSCNDGSLSAFASNVGSVDASNGSAGCYADCYGGESTCH